MDSDSKIFFGKHIGTPICDIPSSYLKWVIDYEIGTEELRDVVEEELEYRDRFDKNFEE